MTTILAATTTDTLSVVDIALLKKGPSSISSCLYLVEAPIASCWSTDNALLFIASTATIYSYEPTTNILREIYARDGSDSIGSLTVKDKNTVIFSVGSHIHVLVDCCTQPTITQTFDASHKVAVEFMSLSNDNTLLATSSAGAIHIHNLASRSHTVLRGLPNVPSNIDSILFHTHSRTRLLVAMARRVLIYDTNRPSAPTKVMPLSESAPGDVVAAACSPYSKTLVAVATSLGFVVMMDLEREKSQVRTINLKASLTTLEFSPEGGAIYAGSNDGKLLIVDLRSLDKPPKTIMVSETGHPVRTTNIQKKLKLNTDVVTKTPKANSTTTLRTPSEPLPALRRAASALVAGTSSSTKSAVSKSMGSPVLRRGKAVPAVPPVPQRPPSALKEEVRPESPPAAEDSKKNVLSPAKDPLGNSIGNKWLGQPPETRGRKLIVTPVKAKKVSSDSIKPRPTPSPRPSLGSALTRADASDGKGVRRSRTLPTIKAPTNHDTPNEDKKKKASVPGGQLVTDRLSVPSNVVSAPQRRVRSTSRAGLAPSDGPASAVSSAGRRGASTSTSRAPSSASRPGSSISRANAAVAVAVAAAGKKASADVVTTTRTPSPDLPDEPEPITPLKQKKKSTGLRVLGLGTPEVERWIQAGQGERDDDDDDEEEEEELGIVGSTERDLKGKGKTVGFRIDEKPTTYDVELEKELLEKERQLALKVSPRRRPALVVPSTSASTIDSWAALASNSPALSFASPEPGAGAGNLTSSGTGLPQTSAHDLLKTIVQDVMFDFQRDTKAEMMGLHLDLLRMGRSWKAELRVLMDEYVGDLRELREENGRLRKENERLRRGWE